MEIEIWKDIKDYEGYYQVSNLGRAKSLETTRTCDRCGVPLTRVYKEHLVKQGGNGRGYMSVRLNNKHEYVHRLVATAFCENPGNKETVHHIDHNTSNNQSTNLEWRTLQEQYDEHHRTNLMKHTQKTPVKVNNVQYNSMKEADRCLGIPLGSVQQAIDHGRKTFSSGGNEFTIQ